jgi:Na+/H+ antiporter NhaD/arsenite permease-like protein
MTPVAAAGLAINYAVLRWGFRKVLREARIERGRGTEAAPALDRTLLIKVAGVFGLVVTGFVSGLNLPWTALAGAALIMVVARRDTHEVLKLVDWHLLVFFAALFVVVEGLSETGLPEQVRPGFGAGVTTQAWNLTWVSVAGSNIFSNVPFVLVAGKWIGNLAQPDLMWKVLALATTFAGNLTILGSVANIIVVESARGHLEVSFWDYAKFGIPITILTTVAGVTLLLALT